MPSPWVEAVSHPVGACKLAQPISLSGFFNGMKDQNDTLFMAVKLKFSFITTVSWGFERDTASLGESR